jgi:hypothetical protein
MADFKVGQMQGGSPLLQAFNIKSQTRASNRALEMQEDQFKWLREDREHNKLKQELAGRLQGQASGVGANLWDYQNDQLNSQAITDLPFSKEKKGEAWQEYQQAASARGVTADADYFEAQWSKQKMLQDQNVTAALSAAKESSRLSDDEFSYALRGGGSDSRQINAYLSGMHPEIYKNFITSTAYNPRHETWSEWAQPKHGVAALGALGAAAYGMGKMGELAAARAPMEAQLEKLLAGGGKKRQAFMKKHGNIIDIAQGRQAKLTARAETLRTQAATMDKRTKGWKVAMAGADRADKLAAQNMARMETARKAMQNIDEATKKKIAGLEKKISAKKPWEAAAAKMKGGKPGSAWKTGAKGALWIGAPVLGAMAGEAIGGEEGRKWGQAAGFGAPMVKGAYGLIPKAGAKLAKSGTPWLARGGKALMKGPWPAKVAGALALALGGGLGMQKVFED